MALPLGWANCVVNVVIRISFHNAVSSARAYAHAGSTWRAHAHARLPAVRKSCRWMNPFGARALPSGRMDLCWRDNARGALHAARAAARRDDDAHAIHTHTRTHHFAQGRPAVLVTHDDDRIDDYDCMLGPA